MDSTMMSGSTIEVLYPSVVVSGASGYAMVAAVDLPAGTIVEKFAGPVVEFSQVPAAQINHAILIDENQWLVPHTNARFINHSCDHNCVVLDSLEVQTIRPVKKGEELSFSYNTVTRADYQRRPQDFFWIDSWSFNCLCGAANCQGRVAGYIIT